MTCRTEPQWNTQQAVYGQDEVFDLCHVQPDCILRCEVSGQCTNQCSICYSRKDRQQAAHVSEVHQALQSPLRPCCLLKKHAKLDAVDSSWAPKAHEFSRNAADGTVLVV